MPTKIITGVLIEQSTPLNLDELAQAIHLDRNLIITMVEYHLIEPKGRSPSDWKFDDIGLKRAKIAARFHQDLEINFPGIALALDLLEKIDQLEQQLQTWQRFEEE